VPATLSTDRERLAWRAPRQELDAFLQLAEIEGPDVSLEEAAVSERSQAILPVTAQRLAGVMVHLDEGLVFEARHGNAHRQAARPREEFHGSHRRPSKNPVMREDNPAARFTSHSQITSTFHPAASAFAAS